MLTLTPVYKEAFDSIILRALPPQKCESGLENQKKLISHPKFQENSICLREGAHYPYGINVYQAISKSQPSANYSPRAKGALQSLFVNRLPGTRPQPSVVTDISTLPVEGAELSSCDKNHKA